MQKCLNVPVPAERASPSGPHLVVQRESSTCRCKTWAVITFRNNLKDRNKKNGKMEAARHERLSTDGCLLSSNYTMKKLFSRQLADDEVHPGFTLLIDKWTELNKQRQAVTRVRHLLDKNLQADVLSLYAGVTGGKTQNMKYYKAALCRRIRFRLQGKSRVRDVHLHEKLKSVREQNVWNRFWWVTRRSDTKEHTWYMFTTCYTS